ncbi:MAG: Nramp family divalent metal transporter [Bacteroidetes bacterium]|nr:Nramp family divalent metal transporter [Bacteroidota bacterium]
MLELKHSNTSLPEVHETVDTSNTGKGWRKILAFLGPAYLISVGYMDPGNWATDMAGGSQFGYSLIWVLLMSNLMAVLLQSLSARLGIVRGRDLAQASRETYSKPVNFALYFLAEIAIAACDLAEVLGMAIGLNLLFHIPLLWGVCITVFDTFLLLFLINFGIRKMEAFIIALIAVIGLAFLAEMILAQPDLGEVVKGFVPTLPNEAALYIAIGIIGATVMPHNLYLHSSLVQTRKFNRSSKDIRKAIRYNIFDSVIALNLAFFVNSAILILAASTFFKNGLYGVAEIQDAHKFLEPLLGTKLAPALFAIALIASGQSSTLTGTLAGQIVMEGYLRLRIAPWMRRLLTRLIAIIPALITIVYFGEQATGKLLILSQVILSLQLGFAVIPLIHFVSEKSKMKEFVIPIYVQIAAWISAIIIVGLNARLVYSQVQDWLESSSNPVIIWITVVPIILMAALLLLYITFRPLFKKSHHEKAKVPHLEAKELILTEPKPYKRIAIAVDFSKMDQLNITNAISQGGKRAHYLLIHIVESAGALMMKQEIQDFEFRSDQKNMEKYVDDLKSKGYDVELKIGYGNPKKAIPDLVNQYNADLLVIGAHGHRGFKDMILGTTVDSVRHRIHVPVLIVREEIPNN